jgi:hypothetical protein
MRIEVCFSPEAGLVRVEHLRGALGVRVAELDAVELVVIAGVVARQRIELVRKVSGRGRHVAFQCPRCLEPRAVLHAEGGGRLSCAACSGYKTRHQRESSRTEWEQNALDHEDRLFRTLQKRNLTLTGLVSLRRLINEIVDGDHDRLAATMQAVTDALIVADAAIAAERPL